MRKLFVPITGDPQIEGVRRFIVAGTSLWLIFWIGYAAYGSYQKYRGQEKYDWAAEQEVAPEDNPYAELIPGVSNATTISRERTEGFRMIRAGAVKLERSWMVGLVTPLALFLASTIVGWIYLGFRPEHNLLRRFVQHFLRD